jgi:hypothetical protein
MTEPAPLDAPAPTPPPAPAPPAKKKRGAAGAIIIWIIIALAIVGVAYWRFVIPVLEDRKFVVGACLDIDPQGGDAVAVNPNVVDCGSSTAKSKIVAVFDGKHNADAQSVCPSEYVASMERKDKLFCLVQAERIGAPLGN